MLVGWGKDSPRLVISARSELTDCLIAHNVQTMHWIRTKSQLQVFRVQGLSKTLLLQRKTKVMQGNKQ
jgi:hypothetical protein